MDARTGVITQTRRHTFLVSLLGIKHIALAVNKMDLVDFDENVFDAIVAEYKALTDKLGIEDVTCFPFRFGWRQCVEKSERTLGMKAPVCWTFWRPYLFIPTAT